MIMVLFGKFNHRHFQSKLGRDKPKKKKTIPTSCKSEAGLDQ